LQDFFVIVLSDFLLKILSFVFLLQTNVEVIDKGFVVYEDILLFFKVGFAQQPAAL